jgi:cytochrome c-type biogenesis protein CcsB
VAGLAQKVFFNLTLLLYGLGTLHFLAYLVVRKEVITRVAFWVTASGFAAHTCFFAARMVQSGYFPVTNLFEAVSFFAWAITLFFLIYEGKYRLGVLGAFMMPVPLVLVLTAAALQQEIAPLMPALRSRWLFFHTSFAFLGYAAVAVTFAGGVMYLIQERQVKRKRSGVFFRLLPSLEILDRINYHSLTIGFALLTLGIITGAVWAEAAWGTYWSWDPKETWSLITWFIYAAILHARLTAGWRGRKAAWLAIVGFAGVLFTFFGVNLLLESIHAYN